MSKPIKQRVRKNCENKSTGPTIGGDEESTSGSELVIEDNSQHQVGYIDYTEWKEFCVLGDRVRVSCTSVTRSMVQINVFGMYSLLICIMCHTTLYLTH